MRAVITRTVPGTSSAGRARFRPCARHVVHRAVEAVVPATPAGPARRWPGPRRPRRSGRIRAPCAQPRSCASSGLTRRTSIDASLHSPILETRTPALARRGRLRRLRRSAGRAARRCARPSSSCTARWAPARPPSCATCCTRWACAGRIKSPTYAVMEPYELPRLAASGTSTSTASTTRGVGGRGLSRRLRQPGAEARRMAREGRAACCRCPTCAWTSSRSTATRRRVDAAAPSPPRGVELLA